MMGEDSQRFGDDDSVVEVPLSATFRPPATWLTEKHCSKMC